MGTWNAFYVRSEDDAAALRVAREFAGAEVEHDGEFVAARMGEDEFEAPAEKLSKISADLKTDVIWLGFQSTANAFVYHHWKGGKLARSLVYGCFEEGVWEKVEGKAEPWERKVIFPEKKLKLALKFAPDKKAKDKLERIWKEEKVAPGESEPRISAGSCAHEIGRYYGLPHYRTDDE